MIDLENISGLPLKFDEKVNKLIFGEGLEEVIPNIRRFKEMKSVFFEKNIEESDEFYYMYRDIHKMRDENLLRSYKIRYDITVIPSIMNGCEFNKTAGHYHQMMQGTNVSYPEVYEILKGKAHYLLQKSIPPYNKIEEIILVKAISGEKVVIPPNFGHITINPSDETLVMANFMADGISSIYKPYEEFGGGVFFEILEDGEHRFVQNKNYKNLPEFIMTKAKPCKEFNLIFEVPMYKIFLENPQEFKFLIEPQNFIKEFEKVF